MADDRKPRFDGASGDMNRFMPVCDSADPFALPIETPPPPIFSTNGFNGGGGFDGSGLSDLRQNGIHNGFGDESVYPSLYHTAGAFIMPADHHRAADLTSAQLFIVEQPVDRCRFRYKAEQGPHGAIRGANGKRQKSAPKVKVETPVGRGYITASLWTNEAEPRRHVNELWGSDCENGVCRLALDDHMTASFPNLGILRQKEKDVGSILLQNYIREHEIRGCLITDDIREKLAEKAQKEMVTMKDCLHCVRVGFQAYVTDPNGYQWISPVILSTPIYNSQNPGFSELRIAELDKSCGSCLGGDTVWMRCATKIRRDQIKIKFCEASSGWESEATFSPNDVYEQILIIFKTPAYRDTNITERTLVNVYLCRTTDGEYSAPLDFVYLPAENGPSPKRFRKAVPVNDQQSFFGYAPSGFLPGSVYAEPSTAVQQQQPPPQPYVEQGWWSSGQQSETSQAVSSTQPPPNDHHARKRQLECKNSNDPGSKMRSLDSGIEVRSLVEADEEAAAGGACDEPPGSVGLAVNLERLTLFEGRTQLLASLNSLRRRRFEALRNFGEEGDLSALVEGDERLIGLQDEFGDTVLHICARNKQPFALKTLLKVLEKDERRLEVINTQNNRNQTALHLAVKYNEADCAHYLLKAGADRSLVDADGDSAAHYLSDSFSEALYRDLLFHPHRETAARPNFNLLNNSGLAALHLAVKRKKLSLVETLIEARVELNVKERNTGKTALHLAVEMGDGDVLNVLIKNGAAADEQMHDGTTALQLAICEKRQSAVLQLLEAGADHLVKTSRRSPLDADPDSDVLIGESSDSALRSALDLAEGDSRLTSVLLRSSKPSAPPPSFDRSESHSGAISSDSTEIDPAPSFLNDDVSTLDVLTRLRLSTLLDGEGRWERVAAELGCATMVPYLRICASQDDSPSPTLLLLDQLEHDSAFSLTRLRHALRRLRFDDAVQRLDARDRR